MTCKRGSEPYASLSCLHTTDHLTAGSTVTPDYKNGWVGSEGLTARIPPYPIVTASKASILSIFHVLFVRLLFDWLRSLENQQKDVKKLTNRSQSVATVHCISMLKVRSLRRPKIKQTINQKPL